MWGVLRIGADDLICEALILAALLRAPGNARGANLRSAGNPMMRKRISRKILGSQSKRTTPHPAFLRRVSPHPAFIRRVPTAAPLSSMASLDGNVISKQRLKCACDPSGEPKHDACAQLDR